MAWTFAAGAKRARPLVGALGATPLLLGDWTRRPTACEAPPFKTAVCMSSEAHTHDTRKITLALPGGSGAPWSQNGAIANVHVRVEVAGAAGGCCACCKCPAPCGCPKKKNGCCACCSCPDTCGCPKTVASSAKADPSAKSQEARPYNPLSASSGNFVTLLVKKYQGSKVGSELHKLEAGDIVDVRGPNQQWTFPGEGKVAKYCMLAGGTGITPLIQAAGHILENDPKAQITFVTFNKTPNDVLLREELADLSAKHGGRLMPMHAVETGALEATKALLERSMGRSGALWKNLANAREGMYLAGKPSMELLKDVLPLPSESCLIMVCGRPPMTRAVAGAKGKNFTQGDVGGMLKELGFDASQVYKV